MTGLVAVSSSGCLRRYSGSKGVVVNDVHSQLNATLVASVDSVASLNELRQSIARARRNGKAICIAGGRHAMGGQQFASDAALIDTSRLRRVLEFDPKQGSVEVESGIQWPELIKDLLERQAGVKNVWSIAQKQTGANRLSIGGALASNIHSRGLRMKPFIADVESFTLLDATGSLHVCDRKQNTELFNLVIGGYGLFGCVYSIRLRLVPRRKLQRIVSITTTECLIPEFDQRIKDGFLYGDFQFAVDPNSAEFLQEGILSCYHPVADDVPIIRGRKFSTQDWRQMLLLAHTSPRRAFAEYSKYYLDTSGQIYWSDTHQLSNYLDDYHRELDREMRSEHPGTEIITEIYVPRASLTEFMTEVREDFRKNGVVLIYGTIRLIERDNESFLAWATQPYACVVFNLHTPHTDQGITHSAATFRRLIDIAIRLGGSYYLTYHKFATRSQVEGCYPQFRDFLALKLKYDPDERFQSDWYRHYKRLFTQ